MGLLDRLGLESSWKRFLEYKALHHLPKKAERELVSFIENRDYLPVVERIRSGERFPLPKKAVISKQGSKKKRTVYTYPKSENLVLKLLTHLLLREYDGLFSSGLYSFRPGRSAKAAVERLTARKGVGSLYSYKVDISNYFNSIDVSLLLPQLRTVMPEDPELYAFLSSLLVESCVLERGQEVAEQKGIMAGTPLSSFYANLFLSELDRCFAEKQVLYCRYSDDIIVFAETRAELEAHIETIKAFLKARRLEINSGKEVYSAPGEKWTFLGFSYVNGVVDIAPASVKKLKQKMRRKTRALARWQKRNGLDGTKAAKGFIRAFNRKLFEYSDEHDLTWARWFFPVITTAESLRELDRYAEDCIRCLISTKRTKARFSVRYEDLKALGFRSLVHEYYAALPACEA